MSDDLKALNNEAENNDNAAGKAADNNISDSLSVKGTYAKPEKHKKKKSKKCKKGIHKTTDKKTADNAASADAKDQESAAAVLSCSASDKEAAEKVSETAPETAPDTASDGNASVNNASDAVAFVNEADAVNNKRKRIKDTIYKLLQLVFIAGFLIFGYLFIDETVIQPLRTKNSIDKTRDLYKRPTPSLHMPAVTSGTAVSPVIIADAVVDADGEPVEFLPTPTPDPNRDSKGRLLQFAELLAVNEDVKGWLTIPDTNIDYVVVQSGKDNPEYYLDKDIYLEYNKAGTLFIDIHGSVENKSRNLVIHGHNMVSTPEKMFHDLNKYKVNKSKADTVPSYYKKHPLINFDTIYQTGQWKIFAVFITNGTDKKEDFFDYTRSSFGNSSDFLNFVYQIRIRSELNIESVDITDDDQLLMLSTCSYEVDDYRTVVVARKVREGEESAVNTKAVTVNMNPLYPKSYYYRYGGKAPKLPSTFEEALEAGKINWYTSPELLKQKQEESKQEKENKKADANVKETDKKSSESDSKNSDKQTTKKDSAASAENTAGQTATQNSNSVKTDKKNTDTKTTDTNSTDTNTTDTQSSKKKKEQQTDNQNTENQEANDETTDTKANKQAPVKEDNISSDDSKSKKQDTVKVDNADEASSDTKASADKKTKNSDITPLPEASSDTKASADKKTNNPDITPLPDAADE